MTLIRAKDLITPKQKARNWRNEELRKTDIAVTISDHPNTNAYITYRDALRDWPNTDSFPTTRPKLGE
jgi:hypothetical protein